MDEKPGTKELMGSVRQQLIHHRSQLPLLWLTAVGISSPVAEYGVDLDRKSVV